ncbi:hypothetical protein IWZ01DRAFT_513292 [Phyllosticta capitalensis]
MAGIKTTYGKRSKKTTAFWRMTDLFTSPIEHTAVPKPAKMVNDDLGDIAESMDRLRIEPDGGKSKKSETRQRALQQIDNNVCSPVRRRKPKAASVDATEQKTKAETVSPPRSSRKTKPQAPPAESQTAETMSKGDVQTIEEEPSNHTKTPERAIRLKEETRSSASPRTSARSTKSSKHRSTKSGRTKTPSVMTAKPSRSDPYAYHTRRLLRLCSDPEGRSAPRPFETWATSLEDEFNVLKIAEASYGEVYRLAHKEEIPGFSKSDESVIKMIALKPPPETVKRPAGKRKTKKDQELEERIENMSSVKSVLSEVKLLRRMSEVPGFTNFREIHILQGAPSNPFIKAWRNWNDGRPEEKQSIFPDPGVEGSYDVTQLWAVIEMQDAGSDLEERDMETVGGIFGVWDIFWGVALSLGKGEEEAHFEHRDMHMGNICIRPINSNKPIAAPINLSQLERKLNFTGLETTLIDYTLSRAQMTSPAEHPEPALSDIAFEDLEPQEWLFEADSSEEYQYEIYRYMRGAVFLDDPLADVDARADEAKEKGRSWCGFHPQTNLMWLHFLLYEMMGRIEPTPKTKRGKGRTRTKKGAPKSFDEELVKRKQQLEKTLNKVQDILDPENVPTSGIWSAKDLIVLALDEGWLDEKDVIADDYYDDEETSMPEEGDVEAKGPSSPATQAADLVRACRL